jgi:hypothetical protein
MDSISININIDFSEEQPLDKVAEELDRTLLVEILKGSHNRIDYLEYFTHRGSLLKGGGLQNNLQVLPLFKMMGRRYGIDYTFIIE